MTSDGEIDAEAKIVALEDLRDELQEKPVKDTRLAGLYEEVSTAPPQLWNRATAFIDCEVVSGAERSSADRSSERSPREGDANDLDDAGGDDTTGDDQSAVPARAVVTDVSKLARGWWAPEIVEDCDAMVTVDVRADLPLESFVALATEEITESIESIRTDEGEDGGSPL